VTSTIDHPLGSPSLFFFSLITDRGIFTQALGGAPITIANAKGERALVCGVPGIGAPKRPLCDDDFKMKGVPGFADK
jgi:hypothetical protein